jgi:hypothetical protein
MVDAQFIYIKLNSSADASDTHTQLSPIFHDSFVVDVRI